MVKPRKPKPKKRARPVKAADLPAVNAVLEATGSPLEREDPLEQDAAYFDDLTPMQAAFVREFLRDGTSQTAAAIRAGYSEPTATSQASRLLTNANVSRAIARGRASAFRVAELDASWVLDRLREVSDRCMAATPVLDSMGEPTGLYRFDAPGANKALELIGKHLGMFKDKLQVEIRMTHEEALAELE